MAQDGRIEGSKAAVHRKAPALAPWSVGPWALGAGFVLYPWGLRSSQVEWLSVQALGSDSLGSNLGSITYWHNISLGKFLNFSGSVSSYKM